VMAVAEQPHAGDEKEKETKRQRIY
jgi:hypothetical protein